jgi:molybdate transport system substrate-binding protein
MRSSLRFLLILPLLVLMVACGSSSGESTPKTELVVDAAASLQDAFTKIKTQFEQKNANTTITLNFAGSQQLAQQITQGAPVDVFASANSTQMKVVITAGLVDNDAPKTFVRNRLTVITPKDNPAHIQSLKELANPGLKIILADKAVPVGQYALDFLTKASADSAYGTGYKDAVLKNVVSYEQDVKSVFTKVQLGDADAGVVYTSDVSVNGDKVNQLPIPDALNAIAAYPIAPLKNSKHLDLAKQFITFVLSPTGQATLEHYGFLPPQ